MKTNYKHRGGFTLVELVVVISIIGILAAILVPILSHTREKARQALCSYYQRQIALGAVMYATENEDIMPTTDSWTSATVGNSTTILKCFTAGETNAYVYNVALSGQLMSSFPNADQTMVSADGVHNMTSADWAEGLISWYSAGYGVTYNSSNQVTGWEPRFKPSYDGTNLINGCYSENDISFRHRGLAIMSFLDGHAEVVKSLPGNGGYSMVQVNGQNSPSYVNSTNLLNNQPSLAFSNAGNTSLTIENGISANGKYINFNDDDYTVIFVRDMQVNAPWTLFSSPGVVLRAGSIHSKYGPMITNSQVAAFPAPPARSCMQVMEIVANGSNWDVKYRYNNGELQTSGTQITSRSSSGGQETCYLGSDWCNFNGTVLGNQPATMNLAEVMFFQGALNDIQLTKIFSFFQSKYHL